MIEKNMVRRRNYFIKRALQTKLIINAYVFALIVLFLSAVLIYFFGGRTISSNFYQAILEIKNTRELFLPSLVVSVILAAVIGIILISIKFLFISHQIAGPLYRLEKVIKEITSGNLRIHTKLRKKDEMKELADDVNSMVVVYRDRLGSIKKSLELLEKELEPEGIQDRQKLSSRVNDIKREMDYFKL